MQVLTIGNNFPSSFNLVLITSTYISIKIYFTRSISMLHTILSGGRVSTVVKVLCYKSDGRWLDPSWCQWIFH